MDVLFEIIFWLTIFSVVYTYLLYPIVLVLIAAFQQARVDRFYLSHKHDRRVADLEEWPEVAIVIAAYNEEKHIEQRLQNLLNLDYPKDRYRIYIGSDGSDDATPEIIRVFESERVVCLDFKARRGKATVLTNIMLEVKEPLVVFSDANTEFAPDACVSSLGTLWIPKLGQCVANSSSVCEMVPTTRTVVTGVPSVCSSFTKAE